jgi:hypothetical protein
MDLSSFPASATSVNFEYTIDSNNTVATAEQIPVIATSTTTPSHSTNINTTPSSSSSTTNTNNNNKSSTSKHVRLEKVHLVSLSINNGGTLIFFA